MAPIVTISAPSYADAGKWFAVSGILYDSVTGYPITGASVPLYYNGASLGSATTGIDGDYLESVKIDTVGVWTLKAKYGTAEATTTITIKAPPQVGTVTIYAPSTVNKDVAFTISGEVKDQYGAIMSGVSVPLYDNGAYFKTVLTSSFGTYSTSHSISLIGVHELAANAGTKWAYTSISITEPPVEPPPCANPFPWATENGCEGGTVNFIEKYRDWAIWYLTCPGVYGITDPYCTDQPTFFNTVQGARNKIDELIATLLAATLTASPTAGQAPLAVTFTIGISGGVSPYTWSLAPGDGSIPYTGSRAAAGSFTRAHTYTAAGTFTVTLTVTDALGATAINKATATPGEAAPPSAIGIAAPLIAGAILIKAAHR